VKRERRLGHDRRRDAERCRDEHRRDDARQHVLQHDARVARAECLGRLHELQLADDQHLASDEPRHPRPADDADREEHHPERRLERRRHGDQQQQRGEGQRDVGEAHHHLVDPAAVVAGDQPHRQPDQEGDALRDDAGRQRHPRAVDETRPDVAALDVGAEPVRRRRTLQLVHEVDAQRVMVRHQRREHRQQHEQHDHGDAEPGARISAQRTLHALVHDGSPSSGGVPGR
jgi:hypothetical protein